MRTALALPATDLDALKARVRARGLRKVLLESALRKEYDAGLASGQMRLVRLERQRIGPAGEEDLIEHPQARKFFQLGLAAERRGDVKTAKLNYNLTLNLTGDHPLVKDRLARLEKDTK